MRYVNNHLVVGGESYWIALRRETSAVCLTGHTVIALQTAAGVWFAVCETCQAAQLAGPDILDLLTAAEFPKTQPPTATVDQPAALGSGE